MNKAVVASPCNSVCRIDERSGWCIGCGRTIAEIAAWATLDDAHKRIVCAALPARRSTMPGQAGAREVQR